MTNKTRIEICFDNLKKQQKKALIPYVMAGDPNPSVTVNLMHELVANGADIIELGLPFSDPMADGPVVALAAERALASGTSTSQAIAMVEAFRQTNKDTPVVLMGYLNPIEFMGYEAFAKKAQSAGVDGVLMVDLPPEEAATFSSLLRSHDMNAIFLLSPTTTEKRVESIIASGSGYIYYVSLKGVTGSGKLDTAEVAEKITQIKAKTTLPVCVGFGIKDAVSASACAQCSDGIIVGSVLVKQFADIDESDADSVTNAVSHITDNMQLFRTAID